VGCNRGALEATSAAPETRTAAKKEKQVPELTTPDQAIRKALAPLVALYGYERIRTVLDALDAAKSAGATMGVQYPPWGTGCAP
jgi:hypothetical protein